MSGARLSVLACFATIGKRAKFDRNTPAVAGDLHILRVVDGDFVGKPVEGVAAGGLGYFGTA